VQANGKEADGRRLLSLLSLGAVHGTQLRFLLEGTDEEECLSALQTFCQEEWKGGASHE
jgi:phosphotransferase system HPr-like phosphotransfer protein